MIKIIRDLTESDKRKIYEAAKAAYKRTYDVPWEVIESGMRTFIDSAFDDDLFVKMSPDEQIDASYCRKAFGNKCILRKLTAGFAEQNGRDAEPAAA